MILSLFSSIFLLIVLVLFSLPFLVNIRVRVMRFVPGVSKWYCRVSELWLNDFLRFFFLAVKVCSVLAYGVKNYVSANCALCVVLFRQKTTKLRYLCQEFKRHLLQNSVYNCTYTSMQSLWHDLIPTFFSGSFCRK